MNKQFKCMIDENLKNEYDECIIEKYGQKWGKTGSELEKVMKFYLAANSHEEYQNDPDLQAILKKI